MKDKSNFLKPRLLESSEERKEQIEQRFNFYVSAGAHSFLILLVGLVFSAAFYAQILSIIITEGTSFSSMIRFILAIFFSAIAIFLVRSIRKFEDISYHFSDIDMKKSESGWPGDAFSMMVSLILVISFIWIALELSDTVAEESLQTSFNHLLNRGEILVFIARLLSYLSLAGALGAAMSALFVTRYGVYPHLKGLHAWLRRIWFYLNVLLSGEELEEVLIDRCNQCCSEKFKIRTSNGQIQIYCAFCGLEMNECITGRL